MTPLRPGVVYEDPWCTLILGDCREVIPVLRGQYALVVSDPPYGIGWVQKSYAGGRSGPIAGDDDTSLRDDVLARLAHVPAAVFGSFKVPAPPGTVGTLVHVMSPDRGLLGSVTGWRKDVEPIWLVGPWPTRRPMRSGLLRSTEPVSKMTTPGARAEHPHRKPLSVLRELLAGCPPGTVLDPFAGAGSVLLAAHDQGRYAIGIEIEPRWARLAAARLAQGRLWAPPPAGPEQLVMS